MYAQLNGNLIKTAMVKRVFNPMGYKHIKWLSHNKVNSVSQQKRLKWLTNIKNRCSSFH